jgi:ABC-type nitrate/sulfonate/bicarbonate transport system substrate-binding protein
MCAFIAVLVVACSAQATPLRMKLSWVLNDQYAGQIYAFEKGWYKKAGIALTLIPHQGGHSDPYDAVMTGAADVGVGETLVILRRAIRDGSDIVIFGLEDQISPAGFLSLAETKIAQPGDLEHKRYGYYNNSDTDLLKWFADKNGVDYKSIAKKRVMPNDMQPLIDGEIDFIIAHETNEPVLLKLKKHRTNFLSLSGPKGTLFGASYFCKRDYYEKHKAELTKLMEMTSRGWRAAFDHPDDAAEMILRNFPRKDYVDGSRTFTKDKFVMGLGIKKYYLTYKVGPDFICCMSKYYWEMVSERMASEGLMENDASILSYVRFDATRELNNRIK